MKTILSFLICCLSCSMVQAQISHYQPGVTDEGAVYFLPKTVVNVKVLVEKTTYKPGDFSRYAQRYLRLNNVSQEPSVSYRVLTVTQEAAAVADTTKGFAVKFNARTVAANVALSDDGRLLAINATPTAAPQGSAPFVAAPKPTMLNPRQLMNEEILSAGSTAKMAELTAQEIYDLRENRSLLIKGQADFMPQDGSQMRLMLSQLDAQEQALLSLFQGTTVCDTTEHVVTVVPDGPFDRQMLFRLSQINGLVDTDDLSGTPYYISVEDLKTVPPVDEAGAKTKKKTPESGIYVNVPSRMRATVYQGIEPIHTADLPAPQFGRVELLSGELFNKRYTTHLWLNALTGAVERLEGEQPK